MKELSEDVRREVASLEHQGDELVESCQNDKAVQMYMKATALLSSYAVFDESACEHARPEDVSVRAWWMDIMDKMRRASV